MKRKGEALTPLPKRFKARKFSIGEPPYDLLREYFYRNEEWFKELAEKLEELVLDSENKVKLANNFLKKYQKEFSDKANDLEANRKRLHELTHDVDIWRLLRDVSNEHLNELEEVLESLKK